MNSTRPCDPPVIGGVHQGGAEIALLPGVPCAGTQGLARLSLGRWVRGESAGGLLFTLEALSGPSLLSGGHDAGPRIGA